MPPKKKSGFTDSDIKFAKCAGRNTTPLSKYALENDVEPSEVLAYALKKDKKLEYLTNSNISNCTAAFPGTEWYAVSLKGANGNYFYDDNGQEVSGIYYFKLKDTAFAKNENKWFEYNDEIYNEISENNLVVNQNKRIFLVSLSFST